MNVLLLGNGFDLYYKLPTRYIDFLNTVNFLIHNQSLNIKYIGDVFSDISFKNDKFIKSCYETHKSVFDYTPIEKDKINELVNITSNNKWFLYLIKSYNQDIGWIDFEKEISFVISCFQKNLPEVGKHIFFNSENVEALYILQHFDILSCEDDSIKRYAGGHSRSVKRIYCKEYPIGSGNIIVDKESIVNVLHNELCELAEALKLYLQCFVESIFDVLHKEGTCKRLDILSNARVAVTFNYTNTYEKLYFNKHVFHIHGNLNNNIILGVNSDETDIIIEQSNNIILPDTTFLSFKKYYNRSVYDTDVDYLKWISELNDGYYLTIMGHSLDVTDKDIIKELFDQAYEIIILYHNIEAKHKYAENLVKIFGKIKFEKLRREKNLRLLPLDMDFTDMVLEMKEDAFDKVISSL